MLFSERVANVALMTQTVLTNWKFQKTIEVVLCNRGHSFGVTDSADHKEIPEEACHDQTAGITFQLSPWRAAGGVSGLRWHA